MGNVSVSKGCGNSSSRRKEDGKLEQGGGDQRMSYSGSSVYEMMGQSPPPCSPVATRSPLMFNPQDPVIPFQGSSDSQLRDVDENEMSSDDDTGLPTMITWSYGGEHVAVQGSWDNWKAKTSLLRSGEEFSLMKVLPSGVYQYRFLVDGAWKHAPELPWIHDDTGNPYNILDLQEYVPEDVEGVAGFEPPQSPESSYDNLDLSLEDYSKEPPLAPPHLNLTLLNSTSFSDSTTHLPRPSHVMLNHLYVQKGRNGQPVLALGTTHRFLSKYVTVVLYKPMLK